MAKRNGAIDIFRYVCAIMVIAIHTRPLYDINEYAANLIVQILSRIAVPFFFINSGYFYIKSLNNGIGAFKVYLLRIIKAYAIWSCVYFLIDFIVWGYANIKGFLANCIYSFIFTGSQYHFWFILSIIVSTCFVTLFYKMNLQRILLPISILLYVVGCFGCSYRAIGDLIPGLSALYNLESFTAIRKVFLMGIPFFTAGMTVDRIKTYIEKKNLSIKTHVLLLSGLAILWLSEIIVVTQLNWKDTVVITFGLYLLTIGILVFLLLHPGKYGKIAKRCREAVDWTYYVHPLTIWVLETIAATFANKLSHTLLFFLTVLFTWMLSRARCWLKDRYFSCKHRKN